MTIFLHQDQFPASQIWSNTFKELLRDYPVKLINLISDNLFDINYDDYFIGRFNGKSWPLVKEKYYQIADRFDNRIFPRKEDMFSYDDKLIQLEWLSYNKFKIPKSAYVYNEQDLLHFINQFGLSFPLVAKTRNGASSQGVSKVETLNDVNYPCIIQEFLMNNSFDLRVCVIGDKICGFKRKNRENDFRASGSGILLYEEIPKECLFLAYKIHKQLKSSTMAFDFLKDNNDEWVISEMSYTYCPKAINNCSYYYQMPLGDKIKERCLPQQWILENLLQRKIEDRPNSLIMF